MSIVIPTHSGRGTYVAELLQELRKPAHEETVEVLVVDSSDGAEATELEQRCAAVGGCRYLRGPLDAATKRNIGAQAARGELLLFVDSDCVITDESIQAHIDFMSQAPEGVGAAIGPTRMIDRNDVHPWPIVRHSRMYNQCYDWPDRFNRVLWGTTSNLVVRAAAFREVGGFRAMFPAPVGGEDVDFGVRLTEAGYEIATNPMAEVSHRRAHIGGLRPIARSLFHYGAADAALVDLHNQRTQLHVPTHVAGAMLAGAVLAAGGRRTKAVVGLAALASIAVGTTRARKSMYEVSGNESTTSRSWVEIPRQLAARGLDGVFTLGVIVGAARRNRPGLALKRFVYVDRAGFELRSEA
ncbi:glycosyltransferase [Streptomyces sp. B21-105]|uniref:glycosyltransferase family 2 protein n=1 Tax=Streptomyces sp. B21-105 TaxID=3039417 RepID=UPI002FF1099D